MAHKGKRTEAVGYMRTSSATNVGDGKDSEKRQRAAIEGFENVPASRLCWSALPATACAQSS